MTQELFHRDLRAALDQLVPTSVPMSLTRKVGALPANGTRSPGRIRRLTSTVTGIAAVVAIVMVGALVFSRSGWQQASPGAAAATRAFTWRTQMATLAADSMTIEVGGGSFPVPKDLTAHSDPGSATYRTLELTWNDEGTEMRLSIYFGANSDFWWIDQIRTYDGGTPGDWIYYLGPPDRTPLGQSYSGNVDLYGLGLGGVGRLLIDHMTLTAFEPGTVPSAFDECRPVGPDRGSLAGPYAQPAHPDMSEYGIAEGMVASEVQSLLVGQGICHEFRLQFPAINRDQIWCSAPPGKVREFSFGLSRQIIVFIEDPSKLPLDTELPQVVGC